MVSAVAIPVFLRSIANQRPVSRREYLQETKMVCMAGWASRWSLGRLRGRSLRHGCPQPSSNCQWSVSTSQIISSWPGFFESIYIPLDIQSVGSKCCCGTLDEVRLQAAGVKKRRGAASRRNPRDVLLQCQSSPYSAK